MENTPSKTELFRVFRSQLEPEGATEINTDVVDDLNAVCHVGRTLKFLGKFGTRIATLFAKCAGAGFVILVAIAPLIPNETPIYVPTKDCPSLTAQHDQGISLHEFANFPGSGTLQLYVSQFGIRAQPITPKTDGIYDVRPGDKFMIVSGSQAPLLTTFA